MKKILSVLLIIICLCNCSCICLISHGADSLVSIGDFTINTAVESASQDKKEAQLHSYTGTDEVLNIPECIGEYTITSVKSSVLRSKAVAERVKKIIIPKTVTNIGEQSNEPLYFCVACSSIEVDAQNPVYSSENGILYSKDKTVLVRVPGAYTKGKLIIPDGVRILGNGSISYCLCTDIEFPQTLESIGNRALAHCMVEELYLPDSLLSIHTNALMYSDATKYVYFGSKIRLDMPLTELSGVREYAVSGENPNLSAHDGILYNKEKTKLISYPPAKQTEVFVIPDSVNSLGNSAFYGARITTLQTNSVQQINNGDIGASHNIKSLVFGEGLKSIELGQDCYRANSWTFLSKDCTIKKNSYSAQKKNVNAYYGSTAYEFFYLNEQIRNQFDFVLLDDEPEYGFIFTDLSNDTLRLDSFISPNTSLEVPDFVDGKRVVQIAANAFKQNSFATELILPQTLETIDSHAFDGLTLVATLTIPASVTKIGSYALNSMSTLSKINVNSFSCEIGENAFPNAKIFACTGSTAESYAANNSLSFVSVGHQFCSEEIENEMLKKTCNICGYSEVVKNPNANHQYESKVIAPTCTEQGYTVFTCKVCGDNYTSDYKAALGHSLFEIPATAPTCTVEGKSAGTQCARCKLVLKEQEPIAKLTHEYDGGKITTVPTCVKKGVKTFSCRNCEHFYTVELEKVEHRYIALITAPTCTQKGYTIYTCSVCGDKYQADETDLSAHQPRIIAAVAPTCTQEGTTEGSECSVCSVIIKKPMPIAKLPHEFDGGKLTRQPTCQQEGVKTFKCLHCDESFTQKIPAIDHIYINTVKKAASFSQNGLVNSECSMCRALKKSYVVKAIKKAKLSKIMLTYTGKNLTLPKVTVTDSSGKTVSSKYYSVSYISRANGKVLNSIKAIGQYKVQIKFKNAYSGTKYLYFTVKPATVKICAPGFTKKAINAKWKKDASATGYQVMVAENSSFTKGKKVFTINKNSITSKKISGLKNGKTYYVKIRAYKTIAVDGKKLKIYSSYSALKRVKS